MIQNELHLYRSLVYLYVAPLQTHLLCPVTPVCTLVPYHLCHVHMHATAWAIGKGGWPLLQDSHLNLTMSIHKVFPDPARCVGPLWAPQTPLKSVLRGSKPCRYPSPLPRCPPPSYAPNYSRGFSPYAVKGRTPPL